MNLFNEYENKNLTFLTNYINHQAMDNSYGLTEEDITSIMFGPDGTYSSAEIGDAVFNHYDENFKKPENLMLFFKGRNGNETSVMPLASHLLYPRFTSSEKQWLKYILSNNKSGLFLKPGVFTELNNKLYTEDSCIREEYFHCNQKSTSNTYEITNVFRTVLSAIKNGRKPLCLYKIILGENHIKRQENLGNVFPYKIMYSSRSDHFSLICLDFSSKELRIIPLTAELQAASGSYPASDVVQNYSQEKYLALTEKKISEQKAFEPVRLCIYRGVNPSDKKNGMRSRTMADDRCAYLFSDYDTTCHEDSDGNLIMDITYYKFQYNEVISNILSLGKYVKVISPENVSKDIIEILKKKCSALK